MSRNSAGAQANANANVGEATAVSAKGKVVVFDSAAANLPGGDGVTTQVYARNMGTGKTRLATATAAGGPTSSSMAQGGVSSNGEVVSFSGGGAGLPGANGQSQVFVRDLKRRKTKLASRNNDGDPGELGSSDPSLSANGRWVAFQSQAPNLPGAAPGEARVYVRDLLRKRTRLVSKAGDGTPVSGYLYGQTISADGSRVVFNSNDDALPGDGDDHVFVRDLKRRKTISVDRANGGAIGDGQGGNASISGNGRFVIFESKATNLPGAGASSNQMYVRDLRRRRTILAGRNSAGDPQTGYAEFGHLSANGRYAQFVSSGANLPGGDGITSQTYIRDLRGGKTRLASRSPSGGPADDEAQNGSISATGRWVVFESTADNLTGPTTYQEIFRVGPFG